MSEPITIRVSGYTLKELEEKLGPVGSGKTIAAISYDPDIWKDITKDNKFCATGRNLEAELNLEEQLIATKKQLEAAQIESESKEREINRLLAEIDILKEDISELEEIKVELQEENKRSRKPYTDAVEEYRKKFEAAQIKEKELQIELGSNDAAYRALEKEITILNKIINAMANTLVQCGGAKGAGCRLEPTSAEIIECYRWRAEREVGK